MEVEKFAGSVGPKFRLLKAIPVEVTREDGEVTVWSSEIQEWGCGYSLGSAMDDFGKSLPGLWRILHENRLGRHLQIIKERLETYMEPVSK